MCAAIGPSVIHGSNKLYRKVFTQQRLCEGQYNKRFPVQKLQDFRRKQATKIQKGDLIVIRQDCRIYRISEEYTFFEFTMPRVFGGEDARKAFKKGKPDLAKENTVCHIQVMH